MGALVPSASAETVRWIVKPLYQSVSRLSDDLYKVSQNDVQAVVDNEGRYVVSNADSITPFCEGLSLVLKRTSANSPMKLTAILREDKSVATVSEEVYVDQYPFFSEGLLPVSNKSGKVGYMDANGKVTVPFKYSNPHPFSNGLAAVSKGKGIFSKMANAVGAADLMGKDKVFYINTIGGELKLAKEIGDVYFGSTFKNGEALVINKDKQYCFISPSGQLLRIEPSVTLRFDDRYALTDLDGLTEKPAVRKTMGPDVFSDGKNMGYRKGSSVIVPPQFSDAEPFDNRHAIATRLGSTGVLELINGNVNVTMKKGSLPPTSSDVEPVDIEVVMPKEYSGSEISVEVADKEGKTLSSITDADDGTGKHVVSLMLPKGQRTVRVIADNLEVWNSWMRRSAEATSSAEAESDDVKFSFSSTKAKANAKDAAAVSVTITNNTSSTLSGAVRMTGAAPSVKKITIPAGGKKTISAYFSKVTKKEVRTVTVSVDGHSASRKITLEPFFNF